MTISTIGPNGTLPQYMVDLKLRMAELQVQLGTGKKAQTYGGLGAERSLALNMRAEISSIEGYQSTITTVNLRLNIMNEALEGMHKVVDDLRGGWLVGPYEVGADGRTQIQHTAEADLSQLVQLLNSKAVDRYLFAGRATGAKPVVSHEAILNGESGRAGLSQVVSERALADLGADGLGRLAIPPAAAGVASISEDVDGHPFGFKLTGVTSTLTGTGVAGPAGAPPQVDVTFTATLPNAGETIAIGVALPDGTSTEIRLTATTDSPPGEGEFTIGADEIATAANFEAALRTETERIAAIELRAASATQAASEFFDYDAVAPPQRVDGPPFETATALVDATAGDTVFWYQGDQTTPARQSALAKIDEGYTVGYGARADEPALRNAIKQVALVAVSRFDAASETDYERYVALRDRGLPAVSSGTGYPQVNEVVTELAHKGVAVEAARQRHQEALAFAQGTLDAAEGVDLEEVGAMFLRLQTQLQASYQVTAILSQLTLANFLPIR